MTDNIISIGHEQFIGNKTLVYDHRLNKDIGYTVLSVASEPVKSTCSGVKWIVYTELETPLGNGRTHSRLTFWYKTDAIQAIKYLQSLNVPEYKWN